MKLNCSDMELTYSDMKLTFSDMKLTYSDMKLTYSDLKLTYSEMNLNFVAEAPPFWRLQLYCHLSIELHLGHLNQLKTVMSIRIGLHADPDSDADPNPDANPDPGCKNGAENKS